jgi:glycosyltransferase involved in cell wall biosynthesis
MKLVWLSWKDIRHPQAGGAEVVTHNLLRRWVRDGNEAVLLTSRPKGSEAEEMIDGYRVLRAGSRIRVYWLASRYFRRYLRDWTDIVVDEVNTLPFFAAAYAKKPVVMFVHQLARKVWFYEISWPFSWVGYILEPGYLRLLSKQKAVTISESSKADLVRHGFLKEHIVVIREGTELVPLKSLSPSDKSTPPVILSLGSVRAMKRTGDVVQAFEQAKATVPALKLIVAGSMSSSYGQQVQRMIDESRWRDDIEVCGRVTEERRLELMQQSWLIAVASVKEGWGLTVTEANGQGTPAVAYDVDGYRDSIIDGKTGTLTKETPEALAAAIVAMVQDQKQYHQLRNNAWEHSRQFTFDASYSDFRSALRKLISK